MNDSRASTAISPAGSREHIAGLTQQPMAEGEFLEPLRLIDRQLLRVFRGGRSLGISELIDALGVTATAIRQRLQRLLEAGLIQRRKVIAGRGRPAFDYCLTVQGQRQSGADPTDLTEAMWQEILALADTDLRKGILSGVAKRLGRSYADRITASAADADADLSLGEKMRLLSGALAGQQVDTRSGASRGGTANLPLLNICVCPYPVLRDAAQDRSMCQLETEIFSEALGAPVELSSCVLDGDASCHFVPAVNAERIPVPI